MTRPVYVMGEGQMIVYLEGADLTTVCKSCGEKVGSVHGDTCAFFDASHPLKVVGE